MLNFVKNIWRFRKELWKFKTWDYRFNIDLFVRSLELLKDGIIHYQNHINYKQDVKNINKCIRMIKRRESEFKFDYAQRRLGYYPEIVWEKLDNGDSRMDGWDCGQEKARLYYNEVRRIENLIEKKIIKLLHNQKTGLITWWD